MAKLVGAVGSQAVNDRLAIPEGDEFRAAWTGCERTVRRRISRAVRRAQTLEDPKEAALAVALARNQQRIWRWAWLAGPLLGVLLNINQAPLVMAANAGFGLVLFGLLALLFFRRGRAAAAQNREVVREARERAARQTSDRAPPRRRGKSGKGKSRKKRRR